MIDAGVVWNRTVIKRKRRRIFALHDAVRLDAWIILHTAM
jgi:hypothetical protein